MIHFFAISDVKRQSLDFFLIALETIPMKNSVPIG